MDRSVHIGKVHKFTDRGHNNNIVLKPGANETLQLPDNVILSGTVQINGNEIHNFSFSEVVDAENVQRGTVDMEIYHGTWAGFFDGNISPGTSDVVRLYEIEYFDSTPTNLIQTETGFVLGGYGPSYAYTDENVTYDNDKNTGADRGNYYATGYNYQEGGFIFETQQGTPNQLSVTLEITDISAGFSEYAVSFVDTAAPTLRNLHREVAPFITIQIPKTTNDLVDGTDFNTSGVYIQGIKRAVPFTLDATNSYLKRKIIKPITYINGLYCQNTIYNTSGDAYPQPSRLYLFEGTTALVGSSRFSTSQTLGEGVGGHLTLITDSDSICTPDQRNVAGDRPHMFPNTRATATRDFFPSYLRSSGVSGNAYSSNMICVVDGYTFNNYTLQANGAYHYQEDDAVYFEGPVYESPVGGFYNLTYQIAGTGTSGFTPFVSTRQGRMYYIGEETSFSTSATVINKIKLNTGDKLGILCTSPVRGDYITRSTDTYFTVEKDPSGNVALPELCGIAVENLHTQDIIIMDKSAYGDGALQTNEANCDIVKYNNGTINLGVNTIDNVDRVNLSNTSSTNNIDIDNVVNDRVFIKATECILNSTDYNDVELPVLVIRGLRGYYTDAATGFTTSSKKSLYWSSVGDASAVFTSGTQLPAVPSGTYNERVVLNYAGYWRVNTVVHIDDGLPAGEFFRVAIEKNGTTILNRSNISRGNGGANQKGSITLETVFYASSASDYIEVTGIHTAAAATVISPDISTSQNRLILEYLPYF